MQKLLSIILVLSFFSYQSYHSLIYLNYMINKTYYAEVLCENKDNPEKPGCNGKCHLKKQLDQQKPVEEQHPFSKSTSISFYPELLAIFSNINELENHSFESNVLKIPYHQIPISEFNTSVFHPPEC